MKNRLIAASIVWLLLVPFLFNGCSSESPEGFAIYLTKNNTAVSQMPSLSHYDLADSPIINAGDIMWYDKNTHEIKLTTSAYANFVLLQVPTTGMSFVVCVNQQPIYWGAIWTQTSSQSFNGVTILAPLSGHAGNIIRIQLGYPSASFFKGSDPRSSPEILNALEQAGKLK